MKSIKNQYIDLKEGKMTESQFMRNVRMTLPQYVSNTTLFKQAEKILINKGIISEIKVNEILTPADEMELENIVAKYVKDADDISKEMDAYSERGFRGFSDLVQANLNRDEEFQSWVQRTSDEEEFRRETSESLNEAFKIKDSKEGYYNQDGKEQYGRFEEIDNMNGQEVMAGYVIEKAENPDKDKVEIAKILIKNLKSDPYYYTNYKLTGVRGEKPVEFTSTKRKSEFDQMEEVAANGSNLVDEKNKMQVVKEGLDTEVATIGNPSFGGKTKKVKVGDKAKLQGQEVTITKIDYVKPGSGATSNKIIAKTEDGEQVSAKAAMFEPLDEAAKAKLKSLVRKIMKEMFDGRDNVTDVTGENN